MNYFFRVPFTAFLLTSVSAAYALQPAVEFSADAVQRIPQKAPVQARMYAGKDAVRTEYSRDGQQVIEIVYPGQGKRVVMFPSQGTYMEQSAGKPAKKGAAADSSPCADLAEASCTKMGTEQVHGRDTVKWEVSRAVQGQQPVRSLHWIDRERSLPLREFFPDGTLSELRQVGGETLHGRQAEKWEHTVTMPDGNSVVSNQWYDPELKITVREEMPGGYLRELKNVKVGAQDASLFDIPAGLRKIEPPPPQTGGAPGAMPPRRQ